MQGIGRTMRQVPVVRGTVRAAKQWTRVVTAGWRPLPDFLVIGAQKAGTTSLYHYLTQFTDVRRASQKELHFFDVHHARGERWYRSQFPVTSAERTWITGEATPSYLSHPAAPERVVALVPQVRLVALLRNPVERAYSHFHHSRARGTEPLEDFERALELEAERTDGASAPLDGNGQRRRDVEVHSYVRRSTYAPQLRRWIDVFPASSLLLVTAEELFADPAQVVQRVRLHLGLAPSAETIEFDRRNARSYQQMPDRLRQRLAGAFAHDVAEVEQLLGRPTGWSL
jgi:hypothetical protein